MRTVSDLFFVTKVQIWNTLCLGVRSIEHRNVLGEKINFSVHSARRIAIFGRDDLDPLNINANLFLDPPDPPYMSKNDKMCHF